MKTLINTKIKKKKKKFLYNKNIIIKNFPKKPNKGGIPARDRKTKIIVIIRKLLLEVTLSSFRVFMYLTFTEKKIENNKNKIIKYEAIFKSKILNPYSIKKLLKNKVKYI
jgi:hypothetical protein